jgi:6-phosphogluconolactonase
MAWGSLLEPLAVDAARVHRMEGERADKRRAAADYQQRIADYFSVSSDGAPPSFDLILLGMGDDGHTASLFPATAALQDSERWVEATFVPQLDAMRITLTARLINQAHAVLFLIAGESKAPALAAVLEGARRPEYYPSQLIRPIHGSLEYFVDERAAKMLSTTLLQSATIQPNRHS